MKPIVLIVEDEKEISNGISLYLNHFDIEVYQAFNGKDAIEAFSLYHPDVILLDRLLPDMQGKELCQRFKENAYVGIIFMSALSSKENIMEGFDIGADDYITKPFDLDILRLRIIALHNRLRPSLFQKEKVNYVNIQGICFDSSRNDVVNEDKFAGLTFSEYRILRYIVSKESYATDIALLEVLYGESINVSTRTISVHIANIRKKLISIGRNDISITKTYKKGYKLVMKSVDNV